MGLVLKHIQRTVAGSYIYRRRMPKDLTGIIAKTEFKKKLGDSEQQALRLWAQYHAQVEREIARTRRQAALGVNPQTERQAWEVAQQRVGDILPADADQELRDLAADSFGAGYRLDPETWTPLNASPVDRHAFNLLRHRPGAYSTHGGGSPYRAVSS